MQKETKQKRSKKGRKKVLKSALPKILNLSVERKKFMKNLPQRQRLKEKVDEKALNQRWKAKKLSKNL